MAKKDTYLALLRRGIDENTAQLLSNSGVKVGDIKKPASAPREWKSKFNWEIFHRVHSRGKKKLGGSHPRALQNEINHQLSFCKEQPTSVCTPAPFASRCWGRHGAVMPHVLSH